MELELKDRIKQVLFNDNGIIRAPLRLILTLKVFVIVAVGISFIPVPISGLVAEMFGKSGANTIGSQTRSTYTPLRALSLGIASFIGYPLLGYGVMKYLDKQPLTEIGIEFSKKSVRELLYGSGLGILSGILVMVAMITSGVAQVSLSAESVNLSVVVGVILITVAGASTAVKAGILYYGYAYHILAKITGEYVSSEKAAIIITVIGSAVIGSVDGQFFGSYASIPALVVFAVYTLVSAILRLQTGRISATIGFLTGFNFLTFSIFGLTSGSSIKSGSIFATELVGSPLLTGGEAGVQGSVLGLLSFLAILLLIVDISLIKNSGKIPLEKDAYSAPESLPVETDIDPDHYYRYRTADALLILAVSFGAFAFGSWFSTPGFANRTTALPMLAVSFPLIILSLTQYTEDRLRYRVLNGLLFAVSIAAVIIAATNYPQKFNTAGNLYFTRGVTSIYLTGVAGNMIILIKNIRQKLR